MFFLPAGKSEVSNQTMFKSVSRSRRRLNKKIVHFHLKSFPRLKQQLPARLLVQVSKAQGQQVQVIPQFCFFPPTFLALQSLIFPHGPPFIFRFRYHAPFVVFLIRAPRIFYYLGVLLLCKVYVLHFYVLMPPR